LQKHLNDGDSLLNRDILQLFKGFCVNYVFAPEANRSIHASILVFIVVLTGARLGCPVQIATGLPSCQMTA
jgi:hypothetical protein